MNNLPFLLVCIIVRYGKLMENRDILRDKVAGRDMSFEYKRDKAYKDLNDQIINYLPQKLHLSSSQNLSRVRYSMYPTITVVTIEITTGDKLKKKRESIFLKKN
jgi:hypothetical protein